MALPFASAPIAATPQTEAFAGIRYLTLMATRGCNLACRYCKAAALGADAPAMSASTACLAVERLLDATPEEQVWINIHGGEPLLLPDPWFAEVTGFARRQAEACGKRVRFPLASNGVLLDERRLLRLTRLGLEFSLSLDGPPHLHDRYRQQGAATANALASFKKHDLPVGVTLTLHRANAGHLPEILDWFAAQGVRQFQMNFLEALGRGAMHMALDAEGMVEAVDTLAQHMRTTGLAVTCNDVLSLARDFVKARRTGPRMRCQAGLAMLAMDAEGYLSPCAAAPARAFRLGHLERPWDQARAARVRMHFHNRRGFELRCFDCAAARLCRFACPMAAGSRDYRERRCQFTRLLFQQWSKAPLPVQQLVRQHERISIAVASDQTPLEPICLKR